MKRATGGRVVKRVAATLVGVGFLLLSFVAYQLWGTALYEHAAQSHLRQELAGKLKVPPPTTVAPPGSPTTGATTPTTSATTFAEEVAPTTPDPGLGQPIGLLSIPRIGMQGAAIVEGTDEHQLQLGPGHYPGTALPGQPGNAAIAGHRTTYGAPFYDLNDLQPGDDIKIETSQGFYDYQVTGSHVVDPNNTAVLDSTSSPTLTLTTCNPRYSAATRLVVTASLKSALTAVPRVPVGTPTSTTPTTAPVKPAIPPTLAGGEEGLAGVSTRGEVERAVIWAVLALVAAGLGWVAFRRGRRPWTWAVLATGTPLIVGAVMVCFQHVSLALPQSF